MIVVHLGAMKIYVVAGKKEIQNETQIITKIDGILIFIPC